MNRLEVKKNESLITLENPLEEDFWELEKMSLISHPEKKIGFENELLIN